MSMNLVREDFPLISNDTIDYLDSAATCQKPIAVVDSMSKFMLEQNSTVRRGVYDLAVKATQEFDNARSSIQKFINAKSSCEVIFTRGATEGLNMIAYTLCQALKGKAGVDATNGRSSKLKTNGKIKIAISEMEHHANIVPWQMQASLHDDIEIVIIPILDNGELDLDALKKILNDKELKVLAITHTSNVLGTVNPIEEISKLAHANGVIVVLDACQAIAHKALDVQKLDVDFMVFSAHKIYGPTGIGAVFAKEELLNELPPYHGGGDMIETVSFEKTTYTNLPNKFEAGTPAIVETIGFGAAIKYISKIGFDKIYEHEQKLLEMANQELNKFEKIKIIGQSRNKIGIVSFVFDDIEAFDIGTMLNQHKVAIRTGHHCAQPLMKRFGISACSRLSIGVYNNENDIAKFISALEKTIKMFR